jgi:hypothetical protein
VKVGYGLNVLGSRPVVGFDIINVVKSWGVSTYSVVCYGHFSLTVYSSMKTALALVDS